MKKAIELGPETAGLYHNAARLCGLGASRDPDLGKLGLAYLARAIELGSQPPDLRRDLLLRMGLAHLPEFRRLVHGPASGKTRVPSSLLCPPSPQ